MRTKRSIAAAAGLAAAVALAMTGTGAVGEFRAERTFKRKSAWAKANLGAAGFAAAMKGGDPDAGSQADRPSASGEGERLSSLFEEQAALRAYPADTVTADQISGAVRAFESIKIRGNSGSKKQPLQWNAIGPTVATQPGVLNFTAHDYVTSGRVTTLLVDRSCNQGRCRLWMGAAGGGVWRTERALHTNNPGWSFSSAGLQSNAIGALTQDPSDPSGDTLYAGTGEPNASGDSEAGLGLFKSTDGGNTWVQMPSTLAIANSRAISSIVVDPTNPRVIYVGTASAVRGIASSGGAGGLAGLAAPGVYKSADGGNTWSLVWNVTGTRGITDIALDPTVPSTIYASGFQRGIYRSKSGGVFQQIFSGSSPLASTDRTQFAVTVKDSKTRIYATNGNQGITAAALFRADDASQLADGSLNPALWKPLSSTNVADPRFPTGNFCTGQCWYDQDVQTPPGQPDTVYVIGSYQYNDLGNPVGNARAVLRSTTAGDADATGRTFTDMTVDAQGNSIHPDQHAIVFSPQNPDVFWEGSDGGVVRSSGSFTDASGQCDSRPISQTEKAACARMLSAVPTSLYSLNEGLTTLQFQSISVNPKNPTGEIMAGTQDNGTWLYSGSSRGWVQSIYGDGGQSGFDAVNPAIRFNTFFRQATDTNFRNGDPTKWVITSAPLYNGGESALFYMPIIADPVVGGSMFAGLRSVWRTKDNGGDQTALEANCSEFTTPANQPGCGDWQKLGTTPLTLIAGTRATGNVAAVERAPSDSGTLWAATTTGRVFISRNAAAEPASTVTFARIDSATSPNRFVSGISIDPADGNHAFVSFSGYSSATPATPGHVFDVRFNTNTLVATWTDISANLLDLPVTDVAYDNVTGDLYASCDFGVLRLAQGTTTWEVAGSGLPIVETPGLTIVPGARRLYAATHGMGAFFVNLP